jgi:hypothetical protein
MTPAQFHRALDALGLTRLSAAEWLDVDEKTIRRWRDGEVTIPKAIELLLRYACTYGL